MENLEKRMYFFVIRQLNGLNAGIQAGHAVEQYAHNNATIPEYLDFVKKWRTWIILDGGTTNSNLDSLGSLNEILVQLRASGVPYGYFHEPDLNHALTAVCFLADERVFNFKKYPNYDELLNGDDLTDIDYDEWYEYMGGEKNFFLRELIRGKRLAQG